MTTIGTGWVASAGALIAGGSVVETVSKDIIDPALVPSGEVFVWVMMSALLALAALVWFLSLYPARHRRSQWIGAAALVVALAMTAVASTDRIPTLSASMLVMLAAAHATWRRARDGKPEPDGPWERTGACPPLRLPRDLVAGAAVGLVTGFFGMNFEGLPLIHSARGFWVIFGVMLVIGMFFLIVGLIAGSAIITSGSTVSSSARRQPRSQRTRVTSRTTNLSGTR